jgi:hypothetical protein
MKAFSTRLAHDVVRDRGEALPALRVELERGGCGFEQRDSRRTTRLLDQMDLLPSGAAGEFYHGAFAMAVQHHGFVARYCEIKGVAPGIGCGTMVKAGDVIAFVGKMHTDSMLHLEIYSGPYGKGGLTNRKNPPFQRRTDLQNPTTLLDRLVNDVPTLEF